MVNFFTGCDNGGGTPSNTKSDPTKFEGTWVLSTGQEVITYIFKGTTFMLTKTGSQPFRGGGSFSLTESDITFNATQPDVFSWSQGYTLNIDTLVLDQSDDAISGIFRKS